MSLILILAASTNVKISKINLCC